MLKYKMHSAMQEPQRLLAVQKPCKLQPVAQVEEKPKKGPACKDGPSVTEPPSEVPLSSQHTIQFFGSHCMSTSRRGFFPFDAFHSAIIYVKALVLPLILCIIEILLLLLQTCDCVGLQCVSKDVYIY